MIFDYFGADTKKYNDTTLFYEPEIQKVEEEEEEQIEEQENKEEQIEEQENKEEQIEPRLDSNDNNEKDQCDLQN